MTVSSTSHQQEHGRFITVMKDILARPSGRIGLTLVLFHILLALLSPSIAPYDFKLQNSSLMLSPPSSEHWLGADHLGRDILSRTLMGGREALLVTGIATPLAVIWGGFIGILFGLVGGRVDEVLMRIVDAFLSLPWILKMLVLIVTFRHWYWRADPNLDVLLRDSGDPRCPRLQHMTSSRAILFGRQKREAIAGSALSGASFCPMFLIH
jgi:peptide/nickel transport system permease protein